MTIKWVKVDPLVMNGEPFCYGTRLTVRQLLELRRNGYTLVDLLKDNPELRLLGVASAYAYAAAHRDHDNIVVTVRDTEERISRRTRVRFVTPAQWGFAAELRGSPWRGRPPEWPGDTPAPQAPVRSPLRPRYREEELGDAGED